MSAIDAKKKRARRRRRAATNREEYARRYYAANHARILVQARHRYKRSEILDELTCYCEDIDGRIIEKAFGQNTISTAPAAAFGWQS
jgi:hypothetical protein